MCVKWRIEKNRLAGFKFVVFTMSIVAKVALISLQHSTTSQRNVNVVCGLVVHINRE